MAMIKCIECGKDISDQANVCPSCGIQLKEVPIRENAPVTVELTSKVWKAMMVSGWLVIFSGVYMYINAGTRTDMSSLGRFFIILGAVAFVVAKFSAWWTNK